MASDWLFEELLVQRHFANQSFYVFMVFFSIFAVWWAWRYRLLKFSLLLWLAAGLIGLAWEVTLFASGLRGYSFSGELFLHAVTEGGPGLMIMVIFADWVGMIDVDEYKEKERWWPWR
jgi:hypothetical protein